MSTKHFFLKTVTEKSRGRLRALAKQTLTSGTPVDQTLNVQGDKGLRTLYPIGTVFGTTSLEASSGYLTAGDIYPMGISHSDYKDEAHIPPEALQRAYEVFIGALDDGDFRSSSSSSEIPLEATDKISFLDKMRKNKDLAPPKIKTDGFHVELDDWYLLLRNITNQVNTMMVGPTGGGKTELILLACKKLGISCSVYDMGSMYDPVSGLLGVHRLQEGGVSVFDYAKFTQDISKPGVVLLDELSRAPVTTNNILFPCLDSRRNLPVEIAGGHDLRNIKVHEECCFIATANVGSEYTGTMSMDRALVGRFFPIELDYLPQNMEIAVIVKRCRIPNESAKHIVGVATSVRSLYKKQEISCSLSVRETLMVSELVTDGWTTLRAMEMVFLPLFEGTRVEGERSIITKLLMTR